MKMGGPGVGRRGASEAPGLFLGKWPSLLALLYLLVVEVRRATAEGQHRCVAQRLAHGETAQKDIALRERGHQSRRSPGSGGEGWGGPGSHPPAGRKRSSLGTGPCATRGRSQTPLLPGSQCAAASRRWRPAGWFSLNLRETKESPGGASA